MANERITEDLVRSHFKDDALFTSIKWEEQRSSSKRIQDLLKGESKGKGKGGRVVKYRPSQSVLKFGNEFSQKWNFLKRSW